MTKAGFRFTEDPAEAGTVIVNTCAFIEPAVDESIDTILDLNHGNPEATLVVAGCLPLRYQDKLTDPLPEVDLFVRPDQIRDLPRLLDRLHNAGTTEAPASQPSQTTEKPQPAPHCDPDFKERIIGASITDRILTTPGYAYLKIAEGCAKRCRYCTIPSIRGPLVSVEEAELEKEARSLASQGVRELVLVAQDLTAYGTDRGETRALVRLLERIGKIDGIRWIRLMYLHPEGIPSGLAGIINDSDNILPYLDIPFQHISDKVLQAMGRPRKGDRIRRLVDRLREEIPNLVLRTTFMVGFPAEGDREFAELMSFVETYEIERVGVFTYCPEEGTPAWELGDPVPGDVKRSRAEQIAHIHSRFLAAFNGKRIGTDVESLVEGVSEESELLLQGRTWDQAPEIDGVLYITSGNARAGEIHTVRITESHGTDLFGEIVTGSQF
jgi:ribosomal protein S12 methylthiotransferase